MFRFEVTVWAWSSDLQYRPLPWNLITKQPVNWLHLTSCVAETEMDNVVAVGRVVASGIGPTYPEIF